MMKNSFITTALLILIFLLSSCSQAPSGLFTTTETEVASNSPTRPSVQILDLSAYTPEPKPEVTQAPTDTPEPTKTALPTATPTEQMAKVTSVDPSKPTIQLCENKAELVRNLSLSENTALHPGELTAKVWRVKNSGTCTWTTSYSLVLVSGDPLSSPKVISLTDPVAPGESIDLRVNVSSPQTYGAFSGSWMLQDENDNKFGIGEQADQPLLIAIQVVAPDLPSCT